MYIANQSILSKKDVKMLGVVPCTALVIGGYEQHSEIGAQGAVIERQKSKVSFF